MGPEPGTEAALELELEPELGAEEDGDAELGAADDGLQRAINCRRAFFCSDV